MQIAWFDWCIRINVEKSARGAQMVWSPFWMQIIELYCLNCYHLMIVCTCACAIRDHSGIAWNTCCFCYIDGGHLKTLGFIVYLKNPKKHTQRKTLNTFQLLLVDVAILLFCYFVKCRVSEWVCARASAYTLAAPPAMISECWFHYNEKMQIVNANDDAKKENCAE